MRRLVSLLLLGVLLTSGCGGGSGHPELAEGARWVVVGASDARGYGTDSPATKAWPRLIRFDVLPKNGAVVNLAVPGATVEKAVERQLPLAVAEEAQLAFVWLAVNDVVDRVPPDAYERQLRDLVHQLRAGGKTRVLLGNTPLLDRLPAFERCRQGGRCPKKGAPSPDEVTATVDSYNAAIARIAATEGAELVDLHAISVQARQAGTEDSLVAKDGFHPSEAGHRAVADAFEAVLTKG